MQQENGLGNKRFRQEELITLLGDSDFSKQSQVVKAMQVRGFEVTQSSVSRDFSELGVVKVAGYYRPIQSTGIRQGGGLFSLINGLEPAGEHLLVIKTAIGAATIIAVQIDKHGLPGIVGTIAGDDTIFIATKDKASQNKIVSAIKEL